MFCSIILFVAHLLFVVLVVRLAVAGVNTKKNENKNVFLSTNLWAPLCYYFNQLNSNINHY